jgi:hypothetical protein
MSFYSTVNAFIVSSPLYVVIIMVPSSTLPCHYPISRHLAVLFRPMIIVKCLIYKANRKCTICLLFSIALNIPELSWFDLLVIENICQK